MAPDTVPGGADGVLPAVGLAGSGMKEGVEMNLPRRRKSRGTAIVEFAMVIPMMLFLFMVIIEFGRYSFVQHTLQFATREGVRLALVGAGGGTTSQRAASIVRRIQDCAAPAVTPSSLVISIYPINPDYSDPGGWQGTQDPGLPGSYMRVKTQYDLQFITPMIGSFVSGGHILIQAQSTYRNELYN
jgi:Flp pilus assembly protein TadG